MSRERRGEQRPERGRRRRRGGRRAGRSDGEEPKGKQVTGLTLVIRGLVVLAIAAAVAGTTVVGVVTQGDSLAGRGEAERDQEAAQTKPQQRANTPKIRGPVLDKSEPVAIRVRAVKIQARLLTLGLQNDGTVQIPPVKHADQAGWYEASPTPGEGGPSVIVGHAVRARGMPVPVFRNLGKVKRGAVVEVARADRVIAVFRVDRVATYPVTHFPADEVYGTVDHAGLRLITYTPPTSTPGGDTKNVVVYASLLKSRAAG